MNILKIFHEQAFGNHKTSNGYKKLNETMATNTPMVIWNGLYHSNFDVSAFSICYAIVVFLLGMEPLPHTINNRLGVGVVGNNSSFW